MQNIDDRFGCEVYPTTHRYVGVVKDIDKTIGLVKGSTPKSTLRKGKRLYKRYMKAMQSNVLSSKQRERDVQWAKRLKTDVQGDVRAIPRASKWDSFFGYEKSILSDRTKKWAETAKPKHNLYISRRGDGSHLPVIDLDYPAKLVPSRTNGHWHLYLDKNVEWSKYQKVLLALADAGLVEEGYANASIANGYSGVRIPPEEEMLDEAVRELDQLLDF